MSHPSPRSNEPSGTALRCVDVTHGFGGSPILEDVSVAVESGEVLAIIGPSGTGKSTLLRLLSMFQRPNRGSIRLDGTDVWKLPESERLSRRRRVAMVFQTPNLFEASVHRNVSYGIRIRRRWRDRFKAAVPGLSVPDIDAVVSDTLSVVDMADADDRAAGSLSGGEAQRVAFARALATDPDFLVLDEPTSDLDPRNTAVIEGAIRTAKNRGLGVVVATHDMHQAERIADRVGVILNGQFIETGPTDRIFSNPSDTRTRQFIDGELVY